MADILVLPLILAQEPSSKVSFIREIEPVLQKRCHKCHGPDKQKGGLRLDQRPRLLLGGDSGLPSVVPGEPASSPLNQRIHSLDEEERMPPEGEPLTREEKDLLDRWVLQGAIWPSQGSGSGPSQARHWAFQPITAEGLLDGAPHPVDHFIDRALSKKGITPNPQAAPSQLLRRLSILLTGLPPTSRSSRLLKPPTKGMPKRQSLTGSTENLPHRIMESAGLSIGSMSSAGRKPMDRKPISIEKARGCTATM